ASHAGPGPRLAPGLAHLELLLGNAGGQAENFPVAALARAEASGASAARGLALVAVADSGSPDGLGAGRSGGAGRVGRGRAAGWRGEDRACPAQPARESGRRPVLAR